MLNPALAVISKRQGVNSCYLSLTCSESQCDVQVYYNPDNTVLRGRPEAWLRGGWNRWTHARTFPPQPMQPVQPGGTGFLQGTVEVGALQSSGQLLMAQGHLCHLLPSSQHFCGMQYLPLRNA